MRGDSLISWIHQRELGVYLDPIESLAVRLREKVNLVKSDQKYECSNVFKGGLGCLKEYNHFMMMKPGSIPRVSKVCNVPLKVREDIKLKRLEKDGIVEKVEGSEWLPQWSWQGKGMERGECALICGNLINVS